MEVLGLENFLYQVDSLCVRQLSVVQDVDQLSNQLLLLAKEPILNFIHGLELQEALDLRFNQDWCLANFLIKRENCLGWLIFYRFFRGLKVLEGL